MEFTASTKTVPWPASAERWSSSDTLCVRSKRTFAMICGSSKVPSGNGVRTVITSGNADLGMGRMLLISTPP